MEKKRYTQEELDFLRENCEQMTAKELGAALGRHPNAVAITCWTHFRMHPKKDGDKWKENHSVVYEQLRKAQNL